jgi:hypothetical protein
MRVCICRWSPAHFKHILKMVSTLAPAEDITSFPNFGLGFFFFWTIHTNAVARNEISSSSFGQFECVTSVVFVYIYIYILTDIGCVA